MALVRDKLLVTHRTCFRSASLERIKERMQDEETDTVKSVMLLEDVAVKGSREMRWRDKVKGGLF